MRFTKLRILGFKSFVEPTEFLIEKGLTGVVGPNGCGKSNLVEAIKWVMGESSYKNMRASGMDDVIFSGSANRPARNTAEVTLFLDNSDRTAPAAFNDSDQIEISRRIERESGSVYRINGKEARARDVQLLFADASTGARSPSMVGQGRIGELISAKPRQRRMILEEAAGISGLHTRRHEAELRLKAAEQNLDRVEDVVTQLETQLENLKRQARQANRYRNLSGDIRKCEATLYHLRWTAACEAEDTAETTLKEVSALVADATLVQAKTARDQAVIANSLPTLRDNAASAAAALQRIQLEQSSLEKEEQQARHRISELERRIGQLDHDIDREQQLIADNQSVLTRLNAEEEQLMAENAASDEKRVKAAETLETAKSKQERSEAAFNTTTREIAELNAKRSSLDNAVRQSERQIRQFEDDLGKVARDLTELDGKLSQDLFINSHRQTLQDITDQITEAEHNVHKAESATQMARDQQRDIQIKSTNLEKELGALETEARTLAQVLNVGDDNDWPRLIDSISAEPGYEAALAVALGDDLDAAIDNQAPIHWQGADISKNDPALPEGIVPLANYVIAPDIVKRRLVQIGVVEADDLADLTGQLKVGQRLVTCNGDLARWDGLTATCDAQTPAAQRLAQKNRLADVEAAALDKKAQVNAQRNQLQNADDALKENIQLERQSRDVLKQKQAEQAKARDVLAKAESEVSRITERRKSVSERQERLTGELKKARTNLATQQTALNDVPGSDALQARLVEEQTSLAHDRATLAEARALFETLARESELRTHRLQTITSERDNWVKRAEAASKQIDVLSDRKAQTAKERKELLDSPADFQRKRIALFSKIEEAEKQSTTHRETLDKAESDLREADEAAKSALLGLSETREGKARAEERLQNSKTRKEDIKREIAENLECAPSALSQMAELKPDTALPELSAIETRLERLKAERERLGGVNLRADIEIQEITEQRDNLVEERDDLIGAIRELRNAIASLNKEGRERLLKAFDEVNDHFKRLFTHLFGGGTAELQLTESDDPLEAGLDIMARPPGKKPQAMTLLSGGEQALTAMALIFAVFLTNPAPICVLDEVDAPLDDANVERYCNLLDDMIGTTETRFLTITHNPITMARMNRLFGVTMAERGVSQLVSVDLETAESYREAV